jgi:uncharacterized protein YkwD
MSILFRMLMISSVAAVSVVVAAAPAEAATWLNTNDKAAVNAAYLAEFNRTDPALGYTGNVATCTPGTTSTTYRASELQRIEFYRRLAGVGDIAENGTLTSSAQSRATLMGANNALTHDVPAGWNCASTLGSGYSGYGEDIYAGRRGIGAVDGYIVDNGVTSAGHRLNILSPTQGAVGMGDLQTNSGYNHFNALEFTGGGSGTRQDGGWVSWPSPGWFPIPLLNGTTQWSFQQGGSANCANASVSMTVNGSGVSVSLGERQTFGCNVVWTPQINGASEATYNVTVSNVVVDNVAHNYSYTVQTFNPVVPSGAPDAPASATTSISGTTVTVAWTAPGSNGGSAITGYTVSCSPACGSKSVGAGQLSTAFTLTAGSQYNFAITATNGLGTSAPRSTTAGRLLNAVTPFRLFDTRLPGTPTNGAQLSANQVVTLQVTGANGLPANDVTAVAINLTVTGPAGPGWATAYPCGGSTSVSTLNFGPSATVANAAIVPVNDFGRICVYSSVASHLIVDVTGWFSDFNDGFVASTPSRIMDTRGGTQNPGLVTGSSSDIEEVLTGATEGQSVVVNLTGINGAAGSYVTAGNCGPTAPATSNLNLQANEVRANLAVVQVGTGGRICLRLANGTAHLIVDLYGVILPGHGYTASGPTRIVDTRVGQGGSSLSASVPRAQAVSGNELWNVTVVYATGVGYLSVYPCGTTPSSSTLNYSGAAAIPNVAVAGGGADGTACSVATTSTDLIIDKFGTFA